jgi:hypothetical protein
VRVFLDTNVILDVALRRPGLFEGSCDEMSCQADVIVPRNISDFGNTRTIAVQAPEEFAPETGEAAAV